MNSNYNNDIYSNDEYSNDEYNISYKPLDNDWITEFEKVDKDYKSFYNEDLEYLKVNIIYINLNNEIEKIKRETFFIKDNRVSRELLIGILKNNSFHCEKRYSLLSILKYNIDLTPTEIKDYLLSKDTIPFLSIVKNIDDIPFNKTINMFQDINDLFILFYEKNENNKSYAHIIKKKHINSTPQTKKVYIHSINQAKNIKAKHRYTYRKMT
jgi:hypothetical protein